LETRNGGRAGLEADGLAERVELLRQRLDGERQRIVDVDTTFICTAE